MRPRRDRVAFGRESGGGGGGGGVEGRERANLSTSVEEDERPLVVLVSIFRNDG